MGPLNFIIWKILLLCCFEKVYSGVPVLIWESSAITEKEDVVPALSQLDVDEFTNHLVKKIHVHKPLIVVFLEETLSVEDFSWKDNKYKGSFPQMKNITGMSAKLEFIPSVDDPITSLRELMVSHDYNWKKYDGVKLPIESGIILVVKMKDPLNYEDRPQMLMRHDGNIAEIYSQLLAKHSRIIAIFTGKQSSWVEFESNRVKRDLQQYSYEVNDIKLHTTSSPMIIDGANNITLSSIPEIKYDNRSAMGYSRMMMTYTLNTSEGSPVKIVLRLKFPKNQGRWSFSEVVYEYPNGNSSRLTPSKEISANIGKSYHSTSPVIFQSDSSSARNISLIFNDLQVQAYMPQANLAFSETREYSGPPFFTDAIWSGLIVTFVFAIILTWAITMLLDIRTMDRFDDPKGKTISVTAVE